MWWLGGMGDNSCHHLQWNIWKALNVRSILCPNPLHMLTLSVGILSMGDNSVRLITCYGNIRYGMDWKVKKKCGMEDNSCQYLHLNSWKT